MPPLLTQTIPEIPAPVPDTFINPVKLAADTFPENTAEAPLSWPVNVGAAEKTTFPVPVVPPTPVPAILPT